MKEIVIRNRKELEVFYNESRRAYIFPGDVDEITFNCCEKLIIRQSIIAKQSTIYFEDEETYVAGHIGIIAEFIYAKTLEVDGDVIALKKVNCAHIKCKQSIQTNHIGVYTVEAKEIIANSVYATEVVVNTIKSNLCKADELTYSEKDINQEQIDQYHKIISHPLDLQEFYDSEKRIYKVPNNVATITYNDDDFPLDIGCPLYAESTDLLVTKLKFKNIVCHNLYGDYICGENIKANYMIKSQVILANEITCDTFECAYAKLKNIQAIKVKCLVLETIRYSVTGIKPFFFDVMKLNILK